MHRVVGVVQNVEEDLLQLVRVADHVRQPFIEMLDDVDAVTVEIVGAQLDGPPQDQRSVAAALRCGGIWRAKLSRFCTICLVRCASCRITRRSLRAVSGSLGILHQEIGEAQNRSERIVDFMGDAGDQLPTAAIFSACTNLSREHGGIRDIGEHANDAGDVPCSSRMGLRLAENFPDRATAPRRFQVPDCRPAGCSSVLG